ncbi:4-oxalocrotonate tautomerase [Sinorhizobium meliloti]|uniref:tautomerase family protein n=1 Tax=Rhizobium meliloti TaxID=382 RepID=UPI00299DF584|nr:4-oxalocrotonate tautomerase [Sinorhizobium meliloti]MDW9511246.1 4-oxalocrotonate tautomerase [Sinorhizobium meliloti]MDW9921704.1 4-oxalocrotonate tautomerase [Sinorhizobium meliloti]MDW9925989.1 4-oxalocrotonate tautomerase [Sinorhizobium meliloti]MDX0032850.1 4-oxalocrotonate tautomerase [Sinorhizobium meliloti]
MPIVTVQVTREGTTPDRSSVTAEEKAAIIAGVSQVMLEVLKKPLESTYVVIEEVDLENWGWGGVPTAEYRKLLSKKSGERNKVGNDPVTSAVDRPTAPQP